MRVYIRTAWICLTVLISFATAQEPQAPQTVSPTAENPRLYTLRTESRQIIVAASVYNHADKDRAASWAQEESLNRLPSSAAAAVRKLDLPPARGLSAKDFRVLDNDVEQSINYFQEADFPAADITGRWSFSPAATGTWGTGPFRTAAFVPPNAIYLIGYVPPALNPGECRTIQAVVEGRYVHLNRDRYCNFMNSEEATSAATTLGMRMRSFADSLAQGSTNVWVQAFTFWSSRVLSLSGDTSRSDNPPKGEFTYTAEVHDSKAPATVQIAIQFVPPEETVDCGKNSSAIHIVGIVYKANRAVAGQFGATSGCPDPVRREPWRNYDQIVVPNRFDTQIELTPGDYELRVVVSDGKNFNGGARVPLRVEAFDRQRLAISNLVFGGVLRDASWVVREAAAVSPAPIVPSPLVSNRIQFFPATDTLFPESDHLPLYFEIYEPQRVDQSIGVSFHVRVVDLKSGSVVMNMQGINAADWVQPGHEVIPVGMKLPTGKLKKGSYRLEVQASDSAGLVSDWRQATFTFDSGRPVIWR